MQRGSMQYLFRYPGDPTTPGIASVPDLPDSKRISARPGDRPDEHSHHSAVVWRRLADPGQPGRAGVAARMAGSVAVHLPRWAGAGEGPHAAQAELPVDDDLRRDRHGEGQRVPRAVGGHRQPSRCVGVRRGRSQQRHRGATRSRAWRGRAAEDRMEAEAHDRLLPVGTPKKRA